jgi:hypothetical protein
MTEHSSPPWDWWYGDVHALRNERSRERGEFERLPTNDFSCAISLLDLLPAM